MTWYTASIIHCIKIKSGDQSIFPVYENFTLIEADSVEEAFKLAEEIGKKTSEIDDQLTLNDESAYTEFMGIRKLIEARNPLSDTLNVEKLTTGAEVSYSYYEVTSEKDVGMLANGGKVRITYIDDETSN